MKKVNNLLINLHSIYMEFAKLYSLHEGKIYTTFQITIIHYQSLRLTQKEIETILKFADVSFDTFVKIKVESCDEKFFVSGLLKDFKGEKNVPPETLLYELVNSHVKPPAWPKPENFEH